MRRASVWIAPSATSFSCLCENCLDAARLAGASFADAVGRASVRGRLAADAELGFVTCDAGHEIVLRRIDRPPGLAHRDARQLQLL